MISPEVGSTRRRIHLPSVDFPHPLSPTKPSVSPSLILKETPSTAFTSPVCLESNIPLVIGKYLVSFFTLNSPFSVEQCILIPFFVLLPTSLPGIIHRLDRPNTLWSSKNMLQNTFTYFNCSIANVRFFALLHRPACYMMAFYDFLQERRLH